METLVSLFKADFATIRQLEKEGYKLFAWAGGMLVIGLITFILFLPFIGIPLIIAGVALFLVSMIWMMKLEKRPKWHLFCPYCAGKNDVFKTHPRFDCDLCGRPIIVDAHGVPEPAEAVTETD